MLPQTRPTDAPAEDEKAETLRPAHPLRVAARGAHGAVCGVRRGDARDAHRPDSAAPDYLERCYLRGQGDLYVWVTDTGFDSSPFSAKITSVLTGKPPLGHLVGTRP